MDGSLLEISVSRFLEKVGAGGHKPGSGSATALQGLLSAQLIRTVIELTLEPHRRAPYLKSLQRLTKIKARVESQIYPELQRLLQEDSVQFDKVINQRQLARDEPDLALKAQYTLNARHELKRATEIPVEIARHSIELCQFACEVFDLGFRAARGDSGVALNSALSAIAGCVSIIDLNLLSFDSSTWTDEIQSQAAVLREQVSAWQEASQRRQDILRRESQRKDHFSRTISEIRVSGKGMKGLSDQDIERIAIRLQRCIWDHRDVIWKAGAPPNPIDMLNPHKALELLGLHVQTVTTLGKYRINGTQAEIAGQIEQRRGLVWLSQHFLGPTQRYTAAHELGHALLHRQDVLHRDVPVDGAGGRTKRSPMEFQADRFAAFFLMPKKLITSSFASLFQTERFEINSDTAYELTRSPSPMQLREKCENLRGLSRMLATAEYYEGTHFDSLANRFGVSMEAMAIRLEELELVQF